MTKKVKILYVEDEPSLAKIVKEMLEGKGFEVGHTLNGIDAIDLYKDLNPNICLLDVMLPGKSGFEIGKEIRSLDTNIPIIYLTAKSQTEDALKGFQSGGNDYIRKPFSLEELIVRIQNLLALTSNTEDQLLKGDRQNHQIGQFQLDVNRQLLVLGEKVKKLSYRETQLLDLLSSHTQDQIERKYILKTLWGDDSFFNSRNLDVYITKLRGYLKEDKNVEIITLKGVGYRLVK